MLVMQCATVLSWILFGFSTVIGCPDKLDVVFVIDGSGSVGSSNWMTIQDFLVEVVNRFNVGRNNVRVGMVTYNDTARAIWNLQDTRTFDMSSLTNALSTIAYPGGYTATSQGLRVARSMLRPERLDAEQIIVVITDGKSNRHHNSLHSEARDLKTVATVKVIGVSNYDMDELRLIASSECDIYTVNDFNQMNDHMNDRMDQICGCMPGHFRSSNCRCLPCEMDKYQAEWGSTSCDNCESGETSWRAAVSCQRRCPPGTMIDGQMCRPCAVDTYQPEEHQIACIDCPEGYSTRRQGVTRVTECQIKCDPGERPSANRQQCESCDIGEYQPAYFATLCVECPQNFSTRAIRSTAMSQCEAVCPSGQSADNSGMCMPCEMGKYQYLTFQRACRECPEGRSTRESGSMSVGDCKVVCEPGQMSNIDETECEPCAQGFYQSQNFSQRCIECAGDMTTKGKGSTSENDCISIERQVQDAGMGSGSVAGLVVGLLLLLLLAVIGVLLFLWWRRKQAYRRSRMRAEEETYNEIEGVAPGAFMPVKGKKGDAMDDRHHSNRYGAEPTKVHKPSITSSAYSRPADYDNSAKSNSAYDNSAQPHSPYDNGATSDITYDNTASQEHVYDNTRVDDGYDRPPRPPKGSSGLYANA